MRVELEKINKTTNTFSAKIDFIKSAKVKGKYVNIILFRHVKMDNKILTNHVWQLQSNINTKINKSMLHKEITFVATAEKYYKNKDGKKVLDYCLNNIKVIEIN